MGSSGLRPRGEEPHAAIGEDEAIALVVDLLAEQGFEPQADGRQIEMRRCPSTWPRLVQRSFAPSTGG